MNVEIGRTRSSFSGNICFKTFGIVFAVHTVLIHLVCVLKVKAI
jgi:hypothetical protein